MIPTGLSALVGIQQEKEWAPNFSGLGPKTRGGFSYIIKKVGWDWKGKERNTDLAYLTLAMGWG